MTESERLERETGKTRAALAGTLEELRDRITPGLVVEQASVYARDTPGADFMRNLGRDLRENPLPLLLIGAGIAWSIVAMMLRQSRPLASSARLRPQIGAPVVVEPVLEFATSAPRTGSHPAASGHRDASSLINWFNGKDLRERAMSSSDVTRGGTIARSEREPLWSLGIVALLATTGFGKPSSQTEKARRRAAEDGRGRSADSPLEIPAKGWKDIFLRVYAGIADDRIMANAAGVTFYGLLAIFPGIAALVSIYGLFADPSSIADRLDVSAGVMPGGAVDIIRDQLTRLTQQGRGTLGVSFVTSLAISLWSANGGVKALFDAMNVVYEEKEKRSFIVLNATSLFFTACVIVFLLAALSAMVVLPIILQTLPMQDITALLLQYSRWPVLLLVVAFGLAALYRFGPSRRYPHWRWITWGSGFAALAWLAFSAAFSWYAANFGSFNKTYGSLGAVIGFMTWMWLSVIVILLGAKLNAETEHQTARDTTAGPPKPIGARKAAMADTVGSAQD